MMLRSDSQTLALATVVRARSALTRRRTLANQIISLAAYRARWLALVRIIGVILALVLSIALVWRFLIRRATARAPVNRAAALDKPGCGGEFSRFFFTPLIRTGDTLGYLIGYYPGQSYRDSIIRLLSDNRLLLPEDAQKWAREKPKRKNSPERLSYLVQRASEGAPDQELNEAVGKLRSGDGAVDIKWLAIKLIKRAGTDDEINMTLGNLELDLINVDQRPLCISVNKRGAAKRYAN